VSYTQYTPYIAFITLSLGLATSSAAQAVRQWRIRALAQLLSRESRDE
jgi:hypothetical protein